MRPNEAQLDEQFRVVVDLDDERDDRLDVDERGDHDPVAALLAYYRLKLAEYEASE